MKKRIKAKNPRVDNSIAFPSRTKRERAERLAAIISIILEEYGKMKKNDENILSEYEGYSLLLRELENLWHETKKPFAKRDVKKIRKAACRIAATAIFYINDLTGLR